MFSYKTYVTVETLQKMQELSGMDFVCDGDEMAVTPVQRCGVASETPTN